MKILDMIPKYYAKLNCKLKKCNKNNIVVVLKLDWNPI